MTLFESLISNLSDSSCLRQNNFAKIFKTVAAGNLCQACGLAQIKNLKVGKTTEESEVFGIRLTCNHHPFHILKIGCNL